MPTYKKGDVLLCSTTMTYYEVDTVLEATNTITGLVFIQYLCRSLHPDGKWKVLDRASYYVSKVETKHGR